jgi:hypothetical protein
MRVIRKVNWLWCLVIVFAASFSASAEDVSAHSPQPAVIFYFDDPASAAVWPAIADAFHRETARESSEYPLPADLQLLPATALHQGSEFGQVVQVHLRGRCDVAEQAYRPLGHGPLGWVLRVSGEIQPFVYVDCERLVQFLNPKTLGMDDAQRTDAVATAIARITMHEWLHITLQSDVHTSHGIRRAELSADDLVTASSGAAGN